MDKWSNGNKIVLLTKLGFERQEQEQILGCSQSSWYRFRSELGSRKDDIMYNAEAMSKEANELDQFFQSGYGERNRGIRALVGNRQYSLQLGDFLVLVVSDIELEFDEKWKKSFDELVNYLSDFEILRMNELSKAFDKLSNKIQAYYDNDDYGNPELDKLNIRFNKLNDLGGVFSILDNFNEFIADMNSESYKKDGYYILLVEQEVDFGNETIEYDLDSIKRRFDSHNQIKILKRKNSNIYSDKKVYYYYLFTGIIGTMEIIGYQRYPISIIKKAINNDKLLDSISKGFDDWLSKARIQAKKVENYLEMLKSAKESRIIMVKESIYPDYEV